MVSRFDTRPVRAARSEAVATASETAISNVVPLPSPVTTIPVPAVIVTSALEIASDLAASIS